MFHIPPDKKGEDMENTLVNRLPMAVGELLARRNQNGEIIDFVWKDANAVGLAILGAPRDEIIGQSLNNLKSIFRNDELFRLIKQAVDTQTYVEDVTDIGYNNGPLCLLYTSDAADE